MSDMRIREARREDTATVYAFILKLAEYENLSHRVTASSKNIEYDLFERNSIHAILVEVLEGELWTPVGFCVWYFNYSTFTGKRGIFIEDIFIDTQYRNRGYARAIFSYLSEKGKKEDCRRLEWTVLNWNSKAISFYQSLGGEPLQEWQIFRLELESL